jgi:uncharacterized protein with PIN domain
MRCSFRFYGQLNDFLPYAHRGRPFACTLRMAASVKDVIEGLGVPHPEVDVILVDGEAQDFLYRVRDGDRIAVYPRFEAIDLGSLRRVGLPLPDPIRFAVDEHATKLASLLRLAGFDALTDSGDAVLADRAAAEARVVLTRDVALLKRNEIKWGHWVRNIIPARQLGEVVARFDLAGRARPFSRCLRCNVPVVPVSVEAAASRLLPRTRTAFREFHECPACRRVYWKGAHYHAMCRLLETLGAPAAATTSP